MKRAGLVLSLAVVLAGCGSQATESPSTLESWDDFRAHVATEEETGFFIVNGDQIIESEAELRAFYDELVAKKEGTDNLGTTQDPLIVNRVSGRDDKWSATAAKNITYCVSKSSFGTRYNA